MVKLSVQTLSSFPLPQSIPFLLFKPSVRYRVSGSNPSVSFRIWIRCVQPDPKSPKHQPLLSIIFEQRSTSEYHKIGSRLSLRSESRSRFVYGRTRIWSFVSRVRILVALTGILNNFNRKKSNKTKNPT